MIAGELYSLEPHTLTAIDAFEEVPELFRREAIALEDGRLAEAYLMPPRHRELGQRSALVSWPRQKVQDS